jgi:hypothetical protein
MDGKVIRDVEVREALNRPSFGAAADHHAKLSLAGLRCHDQSRFRSSELARAFAAAMRAISQSPRSAVSEPDEVALAPDVAISDTVIVRGVD